MIVYAYEYCDCIYESEFAVISLHTSPVLALREKQKAQRQEYEYERKMGFLFGRKRGWKLCEFTRHRIRPIPVNSHPPDGQMT